MELIEIVDKNGKFTGEIMEKEEAHNKNLLHNEVAIFVINDKGEVLLQKRATTKKFSPNKWGLCAGHVDVYETLEDGALRELKEEIGIDIPKNELHPLAQREIVIREINSHITYHFYVKSNLKENDFIIQKEELSEIKWIPIDKIIQMINSLDNPTVFKKETIKLFESLKNIK